MENWKGRVGVTKLDMTRKPDTIQHEISKL